MHKTLSGSKRTATALIVIIVFLMSLAAGFLTPVQIMELKIRNLMFELRGPVDVSHSDIVIVEMSQRSDDEIPEKYPWPVNLYGKLVENLNEAGARAIGIDVIFDQRDLYDLKNDTLFAESLSRHGNVILAGRIDQEERMTADGTGLELSRVIYPNPVLREANPNTAGMVNMLRDQDDFIRSYPVYQSAMGQRHLSFGLEIARLLAGSDSLEMKTEGSTLTIGPYSLPLFQRNSFLINYFGGGRTFDYIGFEEIIDDENYNTVTEIAAFETNLFDDPEYGLLSRDVLKDKIVLVGSTMPELQDIHPVPMKNEQGAALMAGVEVHAHALQALLDRNFLYTVPTWIHLLILLLVTIFIVIPARHLTFYGGSAVIVTGIIGWCLLSVYLFISHQIILFYLGPLFAIVFGYGGVTAYQYAREEREKQYIRKMFSSYVSPELVNRMLTSQEAWQPGGMETELTALFTDITNFSTLSEKLSPPQLLKLMNEYLEKMATIVMEDEGTLDKYIGDAVMAFYGAPADVDQHAVKACRSAVKMQKGLHELRKQWKSGEVHYPEEAYSMRMRIGINTGRMIVGNMGSSQRFNYTIIGDQVNIAARCESICKQYGVEIVVTEQTRRLTDNSGEGLLFRFLDVIRVKGRHEPVRIYELIGYRESQPPEMIEMVNSFNDAVVRFQERKWEEASQMFATLAETEKEVTSNRERAISPSTVYLLRCLELMKHPPKEGWDFIYEQGG